MSERDGQEAHQEARCERRRYREHVTQQQQDRRTRTACAPLRMVNEEAETEPTATTSVLALHWTTINRECLRVEWYKPVRAHVR